MKKVIVKVKPTILKDEIEGVYTIYDGNNKGGAIMSDVDLDKAMTKFKEGSYLAYAVKTLEEMKRKISDNFYSVEFI